MRPVSDQLPTLLRGTDAVLPAGELERRLAEGKPLRVKLGVDPTASQVHLGWAVVLRKLRQYQEMGHVAVLIVGDFTARVGDPSQRRDARRRLEAAEVRAFAEACLSGLRRLLLPEPLEVRYNADWLEPLTMEEVLELASAVTLAHLLEREDFARRLAEQTPVSVTELLYPLLQGMDSVAVRADVELGGADQLWNLLTARDIQAHFGQNPQVVMTVPLLVGTDGSRKMSQSFGNYIAVDDPPEEMFGKVMSIPDSAIPDYFLLATELPVEEIEEVTAGLEDGRLHPGDTKRRLGKEIVRLYWGEQAAERAESHFDRLFVEHLAPDDLPEHRLGPDDPVWLPGLLREANLVSSTSEGRRLIRQGAIRINGSVVSGEELPRATLAGRVVQAGKRRFLRLLGE